jgi:hypothetical protein
MTILEFVIGYLIAATIYDILKLGIRYIRKKSDMKRYLDNCGLRDYYL